jgi:hypothetical protein
VRPYVDDVLEAMEEGDQQAVTAAWHRANRALLNPAQVFSALSRDALDLLVPIPARERWHLDLPLLQEVDSAEAT